MSTAYTIRVRKIPEIVVPGKRLGRHYRWDSRNNAYPFQRRISYSALADQLWPRRIGILNQGQVGSCTGNEQTGVLGTEPFYTSLAPAVRATLGEPLALKIYSQAETIDGDGPYPPNDNGSSGPSAAQAALNDGLISGYNHTANVNAIADALQTGPVGFGVNWYDSFDAPTTGTGLVAIAPGASVRGGHEFEVRGVKVEEQLFLCDNSWGTNWGVSGSFEMSFATADQLMSEQGDCTVCVPLTAPAPVPVPVANPDELLWYGGAPNLLPGGLKGWAGEGRTRPDLVQLQHDALAWAHAKGMS